VKAPARPEGDRVEGIEGHAGLRKQQADLGEDGFGMTGTAGHAALEETIAVEQRDRGGLGGGFKGKDLHSARILPPLGPKAPRMRRRQTHTREHGAIPGI
jgi:hypothetical protein